MTSTAPFRTLLCGLVSSLSIAACASTEPAPPRTANLATGTAPVEAQITSNSGADIGRVQYTPSPHGLLIRILVSAGGLSPGWHGAHLHMVGDCSDTAGFQRSGSHVDHQGEEHGLLYEHGAESGDLPNIFAAADGSAAAEMFSTFVTLAELQDTDGSALIIHAGPDDHLTQPIGGAGDRVGCALVPK